MRLNSSGSASASSAVSSHSWITSIDGTPFVFSAVVAALLSIPASESVNVLLSTLSVVSTVIRAEALDEELAKSVWTPRLYAGRSPSLSSRVRPSRSGALTPIIPFSLPCFFFPPFTVYYITTPSYDAWTRKRGHRSASKPRFSVPVLG